MTSRSAIPTRTPRRQPRTAEHGYYPILIPLVLSYGLAAGWIRHRTSSTATTIAMHITIDLTHFLAAALS